MKKKNIVNKPPNPLVKKRAGSLTTCCWRLCCCWCIVPLGIYRSLSCCCIIHWMLYLFGAHSIFMGIVLVVYVIIRQWYGIDILERFNGDIGKKMDAVFIKQG